MELGEKILLARQAAGLSQRQLCGEEITRNMLSQIEHGTAAPSMKTLRYLAERLGKPVSYFLEEDSVLLPNQKTMNAARTAFSRRSYGRVLKLLEDWQSPDPVWDGERYLLECLCLLGFAQEVIDQGRYPYAAQLLDRAEECEKKVPYPLKELARRRLLLEARLPGADLTRICSLLPGIEEELLLRAEAAMKETPDRAEDLLKAAQDRESPRWNLLMGTLLLGKTAYAAAAVCLEKAEQTYPREAVPMLEICYREQGDFQKAYYYACKQRESCVR